MVHVSQIITKLFACCSVLSFSVLIFHTLSQKKLITYKIKKVKEIADSHSTTSTFQPCSELEDEFTGLEIQL
jgi:hypothetical protein